MQGGWVVVHTSACLVHLFEFLFLQSVAWVLEHMLGGDIEQGQRI